MAGNDKVIQIALAQDAYYETDGTTNWHYDFVDLGPVSKMGPLFENLRVHWLGTAFSTYFEAKVVMAWAVNNKSWSPDVEVLPAQSANGQVISSDYTNPANFGLHTRVAVAYRCSTGTAAESGRITAVLEVRLRT